jgi:hypothetical protein
MGLNILPSEKENDINSAGLNSLKSFLSAAEK